MHGKWGAVGLAMAGLVACGGAGGGDETRTDIECARGTEACATKHFDVPQDPMICDSLGAFHEVRACPTENVLATCTVDKPPLHMLMRIYDPAALDGYEQACAYDGGAWAEVTPR